MGVYVDQNGNLISDNSIISPTNGTYNVANWGNYTNANGAWSFNPNSSWNNTLSQNSLFQNMNQAQQQGFTPFLMSQGVDPLKVSQSQIDGYAKTYLSGKGANLGNTNNNSFFGFGSDQFGNKTFAGGTGLQWAGFGANLGLGLWGAYQQHKQTKLAQQAFEEQKALQRANYKMQAKSFNNSLRNQQSGRGFVGMSGSAKRTLGREYDARKAEETY
nr:MAG TPA: hypothetical protein [Caudoviricetes sp.]